MVKEDKEIDVGFKIKAKPKAEVTWYKDGMPLFETKTLMLTTRGDSCNLYISKAAPDDSGTYKCEAKNKLGSSFKTFDVQVEGNSDFSP
jgi:hypothetical protein